MAQDLLPGATLETPTSKATAQPIPQRDETKPDIQMLVGEVAGAGKNYFEPIFNGLLRPHDDTLLTRGQGSGLWIYDEIERDCHAYAVLQKRKMAVIAREWALNAASDDPADQAAKDGITEILKALPFDRICLQLLDAILKGFSVGEVIWRIRDDGMIVPADVIGRDQRRFVFDQHYELRLLTITQPVFGEAVPPMKFIVHRFGAKDNNPYGLGLGTRLFWPVYFKRQGVQFWLTFADKWGNPTAVGSYPPGATLAQRQTLIDALNAIAQDTGIAIPQGMDIKLLEAVKGGGTGGIYDALMKFFNDEISEAVLGETMSTSVRASGLGSGQANVQNEVRIELTRADADLLANTLNHSLIQWIADLNFPGAKAPMIWWDVSAPEDLKERADRDQVLAQIGYRITPDAVKTVYGDQYEFVGPAAAPPNPIAFSDRPRDVVSELVGTLERASPEALKPLFDPIVALVERAKSLEEIRDGLVRLFPDMDASRLATLMSQAMVTAHLTGRHEVKQGR